MEAIAYFLNSLPGQDKCKGAKEVVKVRPLGDKDTWTTSVYNPAFIEFVLIPFFNNMTFHSKKGLDYFDWVAIFNIRKKGFHYTAEGVNLIERILSQMNNNRLSTNKTTGLLKNRDALLSDIARMNSMPSNYEYRDHGKIWIISEKRYLLEVGKEKVFLLFSKDGTVNKAFKGRDTFILRFTLKSEIFRCSSWHPSSKIKKGNSFPIWGYIMLS